MGNQACGCLSSLTHANVIDKILATNTSMDVEKEIKRGRRT